jgi:divalent metal cation (Fe/Co/Zn/Cd) transporter
MSEKNMKPIWFFVGLILLVMGGIIFLSGIYNLVNPPPVKTVLANTHPDIWWGGIMIIFGGLMFLKTRNKTV